MKEKILKILSRFSILVFGYLFLMLAIIMYFNAPNSYHKDDQSFIIDKGMTLRQVVDKLHKEKIIKSPTAFLYIGQLIKGLDPKVRYGEYFFEKNISYYKILHKMIRGNIAFRKVTVAEGLSTHSAIEAIDKAAGLIGTMPANIPEGSLMPETYFYSYNDTKAGMVKRMQDAMDKALDNLWENRDKSVPLRNKQEALILASIVEKETGIESERAKVASVFVNRLRKGMKLQSDPTIIYSFTYGNKKLERPIRVSDIQNKSLFNTYNVYGLPPTPIGNPGYASIKAVLNPIATDYLYFVASGRGDHIFSATIKDHNNNVSNYRRIIKEKQQAQTQENQVPGTQTIEKNSITIQQESAQ